MQQSAADMIGGFMEGVAASTPEPDPPEPTQDAPESTLENDARSSLRSSDVTIMAREAQFCASLAIGAGFI